MLRAAVVRHGESGQYRQLEFSRRRRVVLGSIDTWIVSREDLILSKQVGAKDTRSDLQLRDVKSLLDESTDRAYLDRWSRELDVSELLRAIER
jgi:hypothetical protein